MKVNSKIFFLYCLISNLLQASICIPSLPFCRCSDASACQVKDDVMTNASLCDFSDTNICPQKYTFCVESLLYKWNISPSVVAPSSKVKVDFDIQASDIRNQFIHRQFSDDWAKQTKWWISYVLPSGWSETDSSYDIELRYETYSFLTKVRTCQSINNFDCKNLEGLRFFDTQNFFVGHSAEMVDGRTYPVHISLKTSLVTPVYASPTTSIPLNVYYIDHSNNIQNFPLALLSVPEVPAGRLSSGLFWIDYEKKNVKLSFSTNSFLFNKELDNIKTVPMKLCFHFNTSLKTLKLSLQFDLDYPVQNERHQLTTKNLSDNNPIRKNSLYCFDVYCLNENGNAIELDTNYFCRKQNLLMSPISTSSSTSYKVTLDDLPITFNQANSTTFSVLNEEKKKLGPTIEMELLDKNSVMYTGILQSFVYQDPSVDVKIGIYNLISLSVYTTATIGAILLIRSHGMSFSRNSFWTDVTCLCALLILGVSTLSNVIWIFLARTDKRPAFVGVVYLTFDNLKLCFLWTMMCSACCHWCHALKLPFPRILIPFVFAFLNLSFYSFLLCHIYNGMQIFDCVYSKVMILQRMRPNSLSIDLPCKEALCPDLQPAEWKDALNTTCDQQPYKKTFYNITILLHSLLLLLTLVLLIIGILVLRRGKNLLRKHKNTRRTAATVTTTNSSQVRTTANTSQPIPLQSEKFSFVKCHSFSLYLLVVISIFLSCVLYSALTFYCFKTNTIIPAFIWYIIAVWFPTLVPTLGLLFLSHQDLNPIQQRRHPLHHLYINNGRRFEKISSRLDENDIQVDLETEQQQQQQQLLNSRETNTTTANTDAIMKTSSSSSLSSLAAASTSSSNCLYSGNILTVSLTLSLPFCPEKPCLIVLYASTKVPEETSSLFPLHKQRIPSSKHSWIQVNTTETVFPSQNESAERLITATSPSTTTIQTGNYLISFFSVLQVPLNSRYSDLCLRFVVYEVNSENEDELALTSSPSPSRAHQTVDIARRARIAGISCAEFPMSSKRSVLCEFTTSALNVMIASETHSTMKLVGLTGGTSSEVTLSRSSRSQSAPQTCSSSRSRSPSSSCLPPQLFLRAMMLSKQFDEINGHLITKSFQYGIENVLVLEDLIESPFLNDIPRQFLEIIIAIRKKMANEAQEDLEALEDDRSIAFGKGNYSTLIDQIQDEGYVHSTKVWLQKRFMARCNYIKELRQCHSEYINREKQGILLKSCSQKKQQLLQFLPVNLHIQDLWIGPGRKLNCQRSRRLVKEAFVYDTITVGATVSHCSNHKGGGITSLERKIKKLQSEQYLEEKVVEQEYKNEQEQCTDKAIERCSKFYWKESERQLDDLQWQNLLRKDVCFSQALTVLVTSFCRKIDLALQHPDSTYGSYLLNQLSTLGFLFHVESLLSTQGKEMGMLEDFSSAISDLIHVQFVLTETLEPSLLRSHTRHLGLPGVLSAKLQLETTRTSCYCTCSAPSSSNLLGCSSCSSYTVYINVRCGITKLPCSSLKNSLKISVYPLFFTQGINAMQTIANNIGSRKTLLQEQINEANVKLLRSYCEKYIRFSSAVSQPQILPSDEVRARLAALEASIQSAQSQLVKSKHPEILTLSSSLCRDLGGARVSSCKNALNRTAMAVSLEETLLLEKYHRLPHHYIQRTVASLRTTGVALENIAKNTGRRQYSFTSLQRSLLPEEFRCPEGTYGKGDNFK